MSRTACNVINQTGRNIIVSDPNARGSDWGDTVAKPGTIIKPNEQLEIGSIGDPRGGTETDHWGWIYFCVDKTQGCPAIPLQLFVYDNGNHGVERAELGFYDSGSTDNAPMPGGHIGPPVKFEPKSGSIDFHVSF